MGVVALRCFVEYFRQYLLGRRFTVRTDHQALVWLFKLKEPKGRIARWLEILSYFSFSVQYRPGPKHTNADTLSRCETPSDCKCSEVDNLEYLKCGPRKKCVKRASDMQSSFLQAYKLEASDTVTKESSEQQMPEITRAVKTRSERYKNELGYSSIWEKYSIDQLQKAQLEDPDIGTIYQWVERQGRPESSELIMQSSRVIRFYWHIFAR